MARRSFNFSGRRTTKKGTDWASSSPLTVGISVAAASAVLLESFTPNPGGETVVRIRGMLGWSSDNAAATEDQLGAFGIGVVSQQAQGVGITAIPHPGTDADWRGWMYHTYFNSQTQFLSSVGLMFDKMHSIVIDTKAMRKVGDAERLVMVVENTGASHGITFFNAERILTKPIG